jgi:hypothetical protein
MSETQEKASTTYDPFEPFRGMRDAYLDAMAKAMVEVVNTEAYAQSTGAMLEGYLSALAPFREALDKSMLQTLQQMEMPSRQEVAALAERFTNVEMRLDDMDAKLDAIQRTLAEDGSGPEGVRKEHAGSSQSASANQGDTMASSNRPGARRTIGRRKGRSTRR